MPTVHIGAQKGDIAPTVLMPGDPYRARWAAENFLTDARLVNEVRGMLGFTGTYKGNPVTIHGSGMGMPSFSIYANELITEYDAQTLIRVGSAGGMQPHVGIRDVVLAMSCSSLTNPSRGIFRELHVATCADFDLLSAAFAAAKAKDSKVHVGSIYSSDVFYDERPDLNEILTRHGTLAVEMEAAELYNLCARHGRRGLAIVTISDHLQTGEKLPSEDRERSFGEMIEIALSAAFD